MQPRSALFDATITRAHKLLVRADVLSRGKVIASGLPVSSGSVTGDRSQFARRTCSVVIGDPAYKPTGKPGTATVTTASQSYTQPSVGAFPGAATYPGASLYPGVQSGGGWQTSYSSTSVAVPADLLAPYGNEIRLWRGAVTPAGPELICVGTFGIRSAEFDDGAFKGVTVTGIDRCKILAESRFPYPRSSPAGASVVTAVKALIAEAVPFAAIRVDPRVVDAPMPQVTWTENRDQAITDAVTAIGCEVFCDPLGEFVIQPIPSPTGTPVFTVTSGLGGVLVAARHSLSRDGVRNGVVARGSTSNADQAAPVSQLIVDDDPTSPTYWYGPFGEIVGFYDSSLLTSQAQCDIAARALLRNNIGAARSINYATLVNPALEPGDVVAVVDPVTGVTERHLQDQLTIPLGAAGTMTAQTRSTLTVRANPGPAGITGPLS